VGYLLLYCKFSGECGSQKYFENRPVFDKSYMQSMGAYFFGPPCMTAEQPSTATA